MAAVISSMRAEFDVVDGGPARDGNVEEFFECRGGFGAGEDLAGEEAVAAGAASGMGFAGGGFGSGGERAALARRRSSDNMSVAFGV